MPARTLPELSPRFETRGAQRLVGSSRRYTMETRVKIPQQWQETAEEIGQAMFDVPCYGACYDFEDHSFSYLVGLADDGRLDTEGLDHLTLPAGEYAGFDHEGHISTIADTWTGIFEVWMPNAKVSPTDGPEFELYSKEFDLEKPGGVSIWIPINRTV